MNPSYDFKIDTSSNRSSLETLRADASGKSKLLNNLCRRSAASPYLPVC